MEKLTNKRIYLDYNSTSPLSVSVIEYLKKGDFYFANSSSIHRSGKRSKKLVRETTEFLLSELLKVNYSHSLFYHSGATEGINTIIKGVSSYFGKKDQRVAYFYSGADHSVCHELGSELSSLGHQVIKFGVDKNGTFDIDKLIKQINSYTCPVILNFTWVNNETGVVWNLKLAEQIKKETGCIVHVDSAQAVGKISDWNQLSSVLDFYTFSGHKFGAMKGVGFTLCLNNSKFDPLLVGGGQQNKMRSGTENILGIYSIKLAMEHLLKSANYDKLESIKLNLENNISSFLGTKGEIVSINSPSRNNNTIYFIIYGVQASILLTALDMAGIEVSTGSACSSGATIPSRVLVNMGYNEKDAKSAIRLSLGHDSDEEILERLIVVLNRFL
ncbi:MAG: aminotransferase class V-fold PLP-dependent enzyme [Bdellovibrionales bacterium]|nr:aminotransferase class V-fold PLP-dependent enzyme [Bdellovibrionales bacterium]